MYIYIYRIYRDFRWFAPNHPKSTGSGESHFPHKDCNECSFLLNFWTRPTWDHLGVKLLLNIDTYWQFSKQSWIDCMQTVINWEGAKCGDIIWWPGRASAPKGRASWTWGNHQKRPRLLVRRALKANPVLKQLVPKYTTGFNDVLRSASFHSL